MKSLLILFLLTFVSCFYFQKLSANPFSAKTTHQELVFSNVQLVRVIDGDTIVVNLNCDTEIFCRAMKVRVRGIDTPEIRTKCKSEKQLGRTAKKLVQNALRNAKRIDLGNISRGKFFRIVATVYYYPTGLGENKQSVADLLIRNKLAVDYGKKKQWCE